MSYRFHPHRRLCYKWRRGESARFKTRQSEVIFTRRQSLWQVREILYGPIWATPSLLDQRLSRSVLLRTQMPIVGWTYILDGKMGPSLFSERASIEVLCLNMCPNPWRKVQHRCSARILEGDHVSIGHFVSCPKEKSLAPSHSNLEIICRVFV
jgi:hypothetical protein